MNTSHAIDWLSATFQPPVTDFAVRGAAAFGYAAKAWTDAKPMHGYTLAVQHPFGHIIMTNPGRPEMGTHLIMGGGSLSRLIDGGINPLTMVKWCIDEGAKISRLDLAIDLYETPCNILALPTLARVKNDPGSALKWSLVQSSDGGATVYIGSRKSDKFMRIYDKAVQMGLPDSPWTRFELELKRDTAREIAAFLVGLPIAQQSDYIKGIMKGLFNPDDTLYQSVMTGESIHVGSTKDASDNTLEWLVNSVAKTLAKQMKQKSDRDVWGEFSGAVLANLKAIGHDPFATEE